MLPRVPARPLKPDPGARATPRIDAGRTAVQGGTPNLDRYRRCGPGSTDSQWTRRTSRCSGVRRLSDYRIARRGGDPHRGTVYSERLRDSGTRPASRRVTTVRRTAHRRVARGPSDRPDRPGHLRLTSRG